jgi:hypothetical protein
MTTEISLEDLARDAALEELMADGSCPTEAELDQLTAEILKEYQEDEMTEDTADEPYEADVERYPTEDDDEAAAEYDRPLAPKTHGVVFRASTKQSWKQAKRADFLLPMTEDAARALAEHLNEAAGWSKYRVEVRP